MAYFTTDTDLIEYEPDILKYGIIPFNELKKIVFPQ